MPTSQNDPASSISAVIDPKLRGAFALLVAVVVTVVLVVMGLRSAESFIDGRVELKLGEQRKQAAEQEKRLERIEEQFSSMKDTLVEIRADVRILRARVEGTDLREAPRAAAPKTP
jgi:hypothetical protein